MSKLLNISEASSIAIHSLALIAHSKVQLNATQIASALGFSKNHLAKVLQMLTRKNYLESERGPKGGFRLKMDPDQISLLEIYELVEGELEAGKCTHNVENCPFSSCVYGDIRGDLLAQFRTFFENRKLSDIILKTK